MDLKAIKEFTASKKWVVVIAIMLGLVYAGTNFPFFNELLHSAIKVFAVAGIGTALRSLAFPKTVGKYAFSEDLVGDLHRLKVCPRLIQYWIATIICYLVPTLLFLIA